MIVNGLVITPKMMEKIIVQTKLYPPPIPFHTWEISKKKAWERGWGNAMLIIKQILEGKEVKTTK